MRGAGDTSRLIKQNPTFGLVHRALRAATLSDHALIDRMLLRLNLSRAEDYQLFLAIHFASIGILKRDWRFQDFEDFEGMQRCIQNDLVTLGRATAALPFLPNESANHSNGLGVAYVLRGSRLGAEVLRRGVPLTFPTTYLDFSPALAWSEFLLELERIAEDLDGIRDAVLGARTAVRSFATEYTLALA
jgi:heme oxygenase (biliverdin-IX-beta and delta-forming)